MQASVTWKEGLSFTGEAKSGYSLDLGGSAQAGGAEDGFRPMELMALSLAGCAGMDVISILKKKRQEVTDFKVQIYPKFANSYPYVWTEVTVEYLVTGRDIDPAAVERAIDLSITKYCPATRMIGKSATVKTKYAVFEAEPEL
jgi:putative redox protein